MTNKKPSMALFIGCFIALITTAFAFFSRISLCSGRFVTDFNLDKGEVGELIGAGIWPFGISIIVFSLIIDKVGYKFSMFFSFICYALYVLMAVMAYGAIQGVEGVELAEAQKKGYSLLYWGSIILALGNGTVEAFINPVVATMFNKDKTKWLNILHAGWPGGLVIGGIITISMAEIAKSGDWRMVVGIVFVPAVIYTLILAFVKFPVNERKAAGVSYKEMLGEFGFFGALVAFGLIFFQLAATFEPKLLSAFKGLTSTHIDIITYILTGIVAIGFVIYTKNMGRGIMVFLIIIMMPLAITEIGTDGWISGLIEHPMKEAGFHPGWVLVYTSAIMMFLRFFAGPIVHKLSPIGLLIASSIMAILGLLALSQTSSSGLLVIFIAATLYGIGKTFFWPTMLGVTSEQCPKGGALALNAISGIGMIAVGIIGFPLIGSLQEQTASNTITKFDSKLAKSILVEKKYLLGKYKAIDPKKSSQISKKSGKELIAKANKAGQFNTLAKMAIFPGFMFVCYIILYLFFKSKGGYKPQVID